MLTSTFIAVVLWVCAFDLSFVDAAHLRSRGSEPMQDPQLSRSGYIVPTQGGLTCTYQGDCTSTLLPPTTGKNLQYLTLARGVNTYGCAERKSTEPPLLLSQTTSMWDAAPLLPHIPNEGSFHTLIPQFLKFDYAALANSSLLCIGEIVSFNAQTYTVNIFDVTSFPTEVQTLVNAPEHPDDNLQWAQSISPDLTWIVYRVETAGGVAPKTCNGQKDVITVDYAAEYWFYH